MASEVSTLCRWYDDQLRGEVELCGAVSRKRVGPLWCAQFSDRGFVTYRSLDEIGGDALDRLIVDTVAYYRDDTDCREFEWKTRAHDRPADLPDRLVAHGLEPEDVETVMIGNAESMAVDVLVPGASIRRAGDGGDVLADLRRANEVRDAVFGAHGPSADELAANIAHNPDGFEAWIAEVDGQVVGVGRLERVAGTDFAGLWGGAVLPEWRGRGIYRAITSARAKSALAMGATLLQSDCSEMSRPILERNGFVAATTTTPYVWRQRGDSI